MSHQPLTKTSSLKIAAAYSAVRMPLLVGPEILSSSYKKFLHVRYNILDVICSSESMFYKNEESS